MTKNSFLNFVIIVLLKVTMKVLLNSFVGTDGFGKVSKHISTKQNNINAEGKNSKEIPSLCYRPIFKANYDANFIISQTGNLCAYSRKPMLTNYELRSIYAKLIKKTNSQSAVNFLNEYTQYMQDVELEVFDFLKKYTEGGKKNFSDILNDKKVDSINNLRLVQNKILDSAETDNIINSLDGHSRDYVEQIRENAIYRIYDGSFSRRDVLRQIENIETNKENRKKLDELYCLWYKLPRSFMNFDAFVVKYSDMPHKIIAQRLISMSEKTVEHIIPTARGGEDKLSNFAPVLKLYNNDRGDMPLDIYDILNPSIGIKQNLQKYINSVSNDMMNEKSLFSTKKQYIKEFSKNVKEETNGNIILKNKKIKPKTADKTGKLTSSQKGKNRYISYNR